MSCQFVTTADTLRVTRLDNCGKPIVGASNAYVTNCIASLSMAANTDAQDDLTFRAANGTLCSYKKGCVTLLGYDATLTVLNSSPELVDLITGNPVVMPATGTAPIGWDSCSINCNGQGWALELWTNILNDSCATGGKPQWLYTLIPWLRLGALGDIEFNDGAFNLELTGSSQAGGQWGTGPFNVVADATGNPGKMLTPVGATCHRRMFVTDVAPPTASCNYVAVA